MVLLHVVTLGGLLGALAAGQAVRVSSRIVTGKGLVLLECRYFTGLSIRKVTFVRTPEAITDCPLISRF